MRLDTPVETYKIGKHEVMVKRDDLMGDNKKLPPWAKLHAIKEVLTKMDPDKPIIHLNVFGSWSGWALSKLAKKHEVHIVHPITKKIKDEYLDKIITNGGKLLPIRHNMMRVLYAQAKNMGDDKGYQMLPYAFGTPWYLNPMARRFRETVASLGKIDNLVISSGAGVTVSGLAKAFLSLNPKGHVYTICVSSEGAITKTMTQWKIPLENVTIVHSPFEFSDVMPKVAPAPFPCNQFWDMKAWHWLTENSEIMRRKKTLFWNLGGEYTFL